MGNKYTIFNCFSVFDQPNVIFYYRGPISSTVLKDISKDIRGLYDENIVIFRRIFAIYMELAQNILYYSAEKIKRKSTEDSIGAIYLIQDQEDFYLCCGNLIENEYLKTIYENCDFINTMDREKLRIYKREQRKAPQGERSKGAGIGLIQVALTSRNPIFFQHKQLDDQFSFFSLTIKVNEHTLDLPKIEYDKEQSKNL